MIQQNNQTKFLEEIFNQALQLWEEGKSLKEILDMFPKHQKELQEVFRIAEIIKEEKSKILPSKEILRKILSQINIPSITKTEESRYIYREKIKGRFSILQVLNIEKILNFMSKKQYVLTGAAVIIIAVVVGIYWQSQKAAISPEIQELAYETKMLSQDITDLEAIEQDKNLKTLENDLLALAEETPTEGKPIAETHPVDVSEVENLESELSVELDAFLNDLSDLEGYEGDTSLDNLDDLLSGF